VAVVMTGVLVLVLAYFLDNRGLGGARCTNATDHRLASVRHFSRGDG
jgi:hypothetical protein